MRKKIAAIPALVALLALSGGQAGAGKYAAAPPITLGEFSRALVGALQAGDTPVAERVDAVLGAVAGREQAPLTEGLAVALLEAAGVDASTLHPDRQVGRGLALALIVSAKVKSAPFASSFTAPASTDASIEHCLTLANHGQCVGCCKEQGMPANTCAKACFVINKPSPSEPIP